MRGRWVDFLLQPLFFVVVFFFEMVVSGFASGLFLEKSLGSHWKPQNSSRSSVSNT